MPRLIGTPRGLNRRVEEYLNLGDALAAEEAEYKLEQAKLKQKHEKRVDKITSRRATLYEAIKVYALAIWDKLVDESAPRTAFLRAGLLTRTKKQVSFGGKPGAQATRDIVEELKKRRGGRAYIRIKEEVDVDKLKRNPAMLKKLSLVLAKHGIDAEPSGESFTIKPHDVQILASRADRPS